MSIELAMWFALGFLAAGILGLLLMAAVWRRAVRLTRRRLEARVPADVEVVRVEMDQMAARHAQTHRRFELALADLRRRNADARIAVGRARGDLDRMTQARDAEHVAREAAEAGMTLRLGELGARDRRLSDLTAELSAARAYVEGLTRTVGDRDRTIARRDGEHREAIAALTAEHEVRVDELERELQTMKVESATRGTTIEAQETRADSARLHIAELAARLERETFAKGLAETASAQERDRAERLDKRVERLVADVGRLEELSEQRRREIERLRGGAGGAASAAAIGGAVPAGDNLLQSLSELEHRNRVLEERLLELEGAGAGAVATAAPKDAAEAGASRTALRNAMADLAAEMVVLTRAVEGPSSPIDRIVAASDGTAGEAPSLADRIRALRTETGRRPSA